MSTAQYEESIATKEVEDGLKRVVHWTGGVPIVVRVQRYKTVKRPENEIRDLLMEFRNKCHRADSDPASSDPPALFEEFSTPEVKAF